jgi:16S rRNA (cytosine967-C5)-methyltransferase
MAEYVEAVHALQNVVAHKKHLDDSFSASTSPLAQQICYGVIRQFYSLDYILSQLLKKPLPAKHLDLKLLLMSGIYSVRELKRPDYASVNATVETTVALNKQWAKGLVNGVLRQYQRQRQELDKQGTDSSIEARLEHPRWLIDMITETWPTRPELFTSNNTQAPLTLRVNLLKSTRDEYLGSLKALGLGATKGRLSNASITLTEAVPVMELPGFADGVVSIQD